MKEGTTLRAEASVFVPNSCLKQSATSQHNSDSDNDCLRGAQSRHWQRSPRRRKQQERPLLQKSKIPLDRTSKNEADRDFQLMAYNDTQPHGPSFEKSRLAPKNRGRNKCKSNYRMTKKHGEVRHVEVTQMQAQQRQQRFPSSDRPVVDNIRNVLVSGDNSHQLYERREKRDWTKTEKNHDTRHRELEQPHGQQHTFFEHPSESVCICRSESTCRCREYELKSDKQCNKSTQGQLNAYQKNNPLQPKQSTFPVLGCEKPIAELPLQSPWTKGLTTVHMSCEDKTKLHTSGNANCGLLDSLPSSSRLTLLRPKMRLQSADPSYASQNVTNCCSTTDLKTCRDCGNQRFSRFAEERTVDEPQIVRQGVVAKRTDFTKLRDRWWSLVRDLPLAQNLQSQHITLKKNSNSSSQTSELCSSSQPCSKTAAEEVSSSKKVSNETNQVLDSVYHSSPDPMLEAIQRNDSVALKLLILAPENERCIPIALEATSLSSRSISCITRAIQLAVKFNRPQILRFLLKEDEDGKLCSKSLDDDEMTSNLLSAVEKGYEECLHILMMNFSPSSWTDHLTGNNVLHAFCRGKASVSAFQTLLGTICCYSNVLLSKLFMAKNALSKTPLHIICERGRDDLLSYVLNTVSYSLVSKLLVVQDDERQTPFLAAIASGAVDIVMSLLMWRGNNIQSSNFMFETHKLVPCSLEWAVRSRNIEMVLLLLDFNDPCGKGYDLTEALRFAVKLDTISDRKSIRRHEDGNLSSRIDLARALIQAGANPYCFDSNDSNNKSPLSKSLLAFVVEQKDVNCLTTMLDTHLHFLKLLQNDRRRDPILRKQPASFFVGLESRENAERNVAMRDALVISLKLGHICSKENHNSNEYYDCALALFRRHANLGETGLEQLRLFFSSENANLKEILVDNGQKCHATSFSEYGLLGSLDKSTFEYQSRLMMTLPWASTLDDIPMCIWLTSELSMPRSHLSVENVHFDTVLLTSDGTRFFAHADILSKRSAKLDAAIRFASMANTSSFFGTVVEIDVTNISRQQCEWMLQHIYHGSIVSRLPQCAKDLSAALCELMLVAEEFLCPTLIQECEMRLLTSRPCQKCFCWSCASMNTTDTEEFCADFTSRLSFCINAETALDILAVSQYVADSIKDTNAYTLQLVLNNAVSSNWHFSCAEKKVVHSSKLVQKRNVRLSKPLEVLQLAAIEMILLEFYKITESIAFERMAKGQQLNDSIISARKKLLDMCLSDYARCQR